MRFMVDIDMPNEPFNQMIKDGTAGPLVQKLLAELKPEAIYFRERHGMRGATAIIDMTDTSQMPAFAEPFFLLFNASVNFEPVMTPEDLAKSGLDEVGRKWA
jgi:hypothetical protein